MPENAPRVELQVFENLSNFKFFVCRPACQPAVRPGSTSAKAPVFCHNHCIIGGFTNLLFRRRFLNCAMVRPLIHQSFTFFFYIAHKRREIWQRRCRWIVARCVNYVTRQLPLLHVNIIQLCARYCYNLLSDNSLVLFKLLIHNYTPGQEIFRDNLLLQLLWSIIIVVNKFVFTSACNEVPAMLFLLVDNKLVSNG